MKGCPNSRANPLKPGFPPSSTPTALYDKGCKRMRSFGEAKLQHNVAASEYMRHKHEQKKARTADSQVINYSDPFAVPDLLEVLECGKFGSVTKEIKDLLARKRKMLDSYSVVDRSLLDAEKNLVKQDSKVNQLATPLARQEVIVLDDDDEDDIPAERLPIAVLDSDVEETECEEITSRKPPGELLMKDFLDSNEDPQGDEHAMDGQVECDHNFVLKGDNGYVCDISGVIQRDRETIIECQDVKDEDFFPNQSLRIDDTKLAGEKYPKKDKGVYVGVEDDMEIEEERHQTDSDYDVADIWKEMTVALECSKDMADVTPPDEHVRDGQDECDHSFVLKDDIGYVCRICGLIHKRIETIIEYQNVKGTGTTRTYFHEARTLTDKEHADIFHDRVKLPAQDFIVTEMCVHPRHKKQMKPHQVEGFNFLLSNLVTENPGGCILAHAPGSGKTFMIISFIHSFLVKYPQARPLVVLPRGILTTWKREFQRWQVEDTPLYDFYSVKADNRSQQLEVLKRWAGQRSILFLGYKQFSSIVSDNETNKTAAACQEILLTYPSILILDEGHTPRNENTDVLNSLKRVQTPRKVVLSGTLYQNHVKEVFNIFDLVRPKFLRLDTARSIIRRILSRLPSAKNVKTRGLENVFYESVERTLQKDEIFKRKVSVIQDLREMTRKILHFYKGDFLDELPGLVDFTVFLNLSPRQKLEVVELKKLDQKFKICSEGSALYVHPQLRRLLKNSSTRERDGIEDAKMDQSLDKLEVKEGVKAKFFLNLLGLCESAGEKLLVFSQYLQPLKFLERLAVKVKGWSPRKEIFVITGDTNSENREWSMDCFNTSPDAKVFFGSIKACGEGISLVGASRIIILDVHLNPSVTRQAIGRAFRPGQEKKVYTYRLVAADSPEEGDHSTCFIKESIAKMWFEWNEYCSQQEFEIETVNVGDCGDQFLESRKLREDVKALYKR